VKGLKHYGHTFTESVVTPLFRYFLMQMKLIILVFGGDALALK